MKFRRGKTFLDKLFIDCRHGGACYVDMFHEPKSIMPDEKGLVRTNALSSVWTGLTVMHAQILAEEKGKKKDLAKKTKVTVRGNIIIARSLPAPVRGRGRDRGRGRGRGSVTTPKLQI